MKTEQRRTERLKQDKIARRHQPRLDEYEPVDYRWDHLVELWDVIRPAWWPILMTLGLCFLVLGNGQIKDLLAAMPLDRSPVDIAAESAGVSGRFWTTFAACGVFAFIAWAFARGLLSIRFPYTPCPFDPPAWHVIVRMAVARILGMALPVSCALSYYSMGMASEAFAYSILAVVLLLIYWVTRRYLQDWIQVQHLQDEAEERSQKTGTPLAPDNQRAADKAEAMGDIDEALEEAEETLEQAARTRDPEHQQTLLNRVAALAEVAGSAVRAASEEFQEADLFDRAMPAAFPNQMRFMLYGILVFHGVAAALFFLYPVALPQLVGAAAIIFLAIAGWLAFGVFAFCYWTRFWRIPPAIFLFTVWLAFASQFNDNHELARVKLADTPQIEAPRIDQYINDWLAVRTPYLPKNDGDPEFPILVVAAEGGGARAAYWTGSVLSELERSKSASGLAARDHILLISGVSGGSLGTASYGAGIVSSNYDPAESEARVDAFLKQDFLSPVTAGALYHDLFTDFVPFPLNALDRSRWLEGSWTDGWKKVSDDADTFGEDFRSLWDPSEGRKGLGAIGAVPLLVYNTTSVRTGSTWTVSPVRFADHPGCESRDFVDLLGESGKGMSLSTAAHLSARFTGISPAGRIDLKGYDDCAAGGFDRFVDGAYYENSGADTAAKVVRAYQALVERFCYQDTGSGPRCDPSRMPIVPVAIVAEREPAANPPRVSHETSSVLATVINTRQARGIDSLIRLENAAGVPLERVELAISWARSDERLGCGVEPDAKVTDYKGGPASQTYRRVPLGWALSQAAVDHMCRERRADPVLEALKKRLETGVN